jgi:hypothetical protein
MNNIITPPDFLTDTEKTKQWLESAFKYAIKDSEWIQGITVDHVEVSESYPIHLVINATLNISYTINGKKCTSEAKCIFRFLKRNVDNQLTFTYDNFQVDFEKSTEVRNHSLDLRAAIFELKSLIFYSYNRNRFNKNPTVTLCGLPCSGKTTLMDALIQHLSESFFTGVDELRNEIRSGGKVRLYDYAHADVISIEEFPQHFIEMLAFQIGNEKPLFKKITEQLKVMGEIAKVEEDIAEVFGRLNVQNGLFLQVVVSFLAYLKLMPVPEHILTMEDLRNDIDSNWTLIQKSLDANGFKNLIELALLSNGENDCIVFTKPDKQARKDALSKQPQEDIKRRQYPLAHEDFLELWYDIVIKFVKSNFPRVKVIEYDYTKDTIESLVEEILTHIDIPEGKINWNMLNLIIEHKPLISLVSLSRLGTKILRDSITNLFAQRSSATKKEELYQKIISALQEAPDALQKETAMVTEVLQEVYLEEQ